VSTTPFTTAITQARDLLRWRSPLRTELWAARLTATLQPDEVRPFLRQLTGDGSAEARLILAALAAVNNAPDPELSSSGPEFPEPVAEEFGLIPDEELEALLRSETGITDVPPRIPAQPTADTTRPGAGPYALAGRGASRTLPAWVSRMGHVACEGAWYGKGDRYGEQTLAALRFRYHDDKEPHLLVVGIDQVNGGLAADAVIEEVKFLDDLDLRPADPAVVAGRVLDAFEVTDLVMGAPVADTLPAVRALALSRARSVPDPVRQAPDDTITLFQDLPDQPGAQEAFDKLVEFLGDRPLWWSPARVTLFMTSWLPREAILSDAAISAMPGVLRAWTRHNGDHQEVLAEIDAAAPRLPALMADDSLAGLRKRIEKNNR
jgi:hypothetical protein